MVECFIMCRKLFNMEVPEAPEAVFSRRNGQNLVCEKNQAINWHFAKECVHHVSATWWRIIRELASSPPTSISNTVWGKTRQKISHFFTPKECYSIRFVYQTWDRSFVANLRRQGRSNRLLSPRGMFRQTPSTLVQGRVYYIGLDLFSETFSTVEKTHYKCNSTDISRSQQSILWFSSVVAHW